MRRRYLLYIVIPAYIACVGCGPKEDAKNAEPKPSLSAIKLPPVEGYPKVLITALQNQAAAISKAAKAWNPARIESVVSISKVWDPRKPIKVAFRGANPGLVSQIEEAVKPWTDAANIHFDFGESVPGGSREWSPADTSYQADVRIGFDAPGYWSVVGNDSDNPALTKPREPSMNFEGFTQSLPSNYKAVVLHEFGHALGFQHEHQSPVGPCEGEFRWQDDQQYVKTTDIYGQFILDPQGRRPGIYTVLGGPPNNWEHDQIDWNLRQLPNSVDLQLSRFDKASIMKYYFPAWMFTKGENSGCFSAENVSLSAEDQRAASQRYPRDPAGVQTAVSQQLKASLALFKLSSLPADVSAHLKNRVESLQAKP